jgi:chromosome segregation ATPase
MIHIDSLKIEEFRGVRKLELSFDRSNFAICGPNGTGKSGVVDALEFVLTGSISRLTGKGRGDLSVKDHGPHVDSSKSPEKAVVTATVWIPSLQKPLTIERTVKNARNPKLVPDTAEMREIIKQLEKGLKDWL